MIDQSKEIVSTTLEFLKGQLSAYCYLVERGKLAADIQVLNRYVEELRKHVEDKYHLNMHCEHFYEGWTDITIYKEGYVLDLLRMIPNIHNPILRNWAWGKLFGYSDETIGKYLRSQ